jgi:hypothetical protein
LLNRRLRTLFHRVARIARDVCEFPEPFRARGIRFWDGEEEENS